MAYETGRTNDNEIIRTDNGVSGRAVKENKKVVNVVDLIVESVTPGSGTSFNVSAATIPVTPTAEVPNFEDSRKLFDWSAVTGLDTLNSFHLLYNGNLQLPGTPNSAATGGTGFVGPADTTVGGVPLNIDLAGVDNTNQWALQSQTTMKVDSNEVAYHAVQGVFLSQGLSIPTIVGVHSTLEAESSNATQIAWNIDNMGGDSTPENPSGIEINLKKINTLIIRVPHKDQGNVKFGFYINNKINYVHEIFSQNVLELPVGISDRPLRIEGNLVAGQPELKIGCFDETGGYFFKATQVPTVQTSVNFMLNSVSSQVVGSGKEENYRPFSGGTAITVVPVGAVRIPLATLKPKKNFPEKVAPSIIDIKNRAIVVLKGVKVSGSSLNLDDGVFIEVIANQGPSLLTGVPSFSNSNLNSSVEIDTDATGITAGGNQIYADQVFPNKANEIFISLSDALSNFREKYSFSEVNGLGHPEGLGDRDVSPEISIVATSLSANIVQMSATFVWGEHP